jgi:hypothetical protein
MKSVFSFNVRFFILELENELGDHQIFIEFGHDNFFWWNFFCKYFDGFVRIFEAIDHFVWLVVSDFQKSSI